MHSNNGRREGDRKRLRETTETIETMETNGDALQCRSSERQLETQETEETVETNGDQWRCPSVKGEKRETIRD